MSQITTFTIIKGKECQFEINVKENGTTTPLELNASDDFTFSLIDKKSSVKYIDNKPMVITDAINGKVAGLISSSESGSLPSKKSSIEDGAISRPNLRLVVSGTTLAQGEMTAIIENVYVVIG